MNVRFLALCTVLPALLSLAACGTDSKDSSYSPETDPAAITAVVATSKHAPAPASETQNCRYCHSETGIGLNRPAATGASAPFQTCTQTSPFPDPAFACHAGSAPVPPIAELLEKNIQDTHFDDPTTGFISGSTNVMVEGYVIRKGLETACSDCHDNHDTTLLRQQQWADSAHGGFLLSAKADDKSGVDDAYAIAWTHYNWDAQDRAACQRCHTSTGASNFLDDPAAYSPAGNDFSHLAGWGTAGSPQNELLYCWGCHSSSDGTLRNPGAFSADYTYTFSSVPYPAHYDYPDVNSSNACVTCHSGRQIGENIVSLAPNVFTNIGLINSHYLAAAGTLYTASGYEFAGLSYENRYEFRHDLDADRNIAPPAAGVEQGPCSFCHMGSTLDHSWQAIVKVTAGTDEEIVRIKSDVCGTCHAGNLTAAGINTLKQGYEQSLEVLRLQLEAAGFYFANVHPYFYTAPYDENYVETNQPDGAHCEENLPVKNWQTGGTSIFTWGKATSTSTTNSCVSAVDAPGTAGTGPDRMGAAFNYNLLIHEPGAFAHNSVYARRLIFDSLDFLDNGELDGTISIDAETYPEAALWFAADTTGKILRP